MADFLGLMKQATELKSKMEAMQAELERYMAHAIGYRPKGRLYATTGHER